MRAVILHSKKQTIKSDTCLRPHGDHQRDISPYLPYKNGDMNKMRAYDV